MKYKQRLKEEQRNRRMSFRLIGLITLIVATLAMFGCSTSSEPEFFDANVKIYPTTHEDNLQQFEPFYLRAEVVENDGGLNRGDKIWIDFREAVGLQGFVALPPPNEIVGVHLERDNRFDVYKFIGWKTPRSIEFTRSYKPPIQE